MVDIGERGNFITLLDELLIEVYHVLTRARKDERQDNIYIIGESTGMIMDRVISTSKQMKFDQNYCITIPNLLSSGYFFRSKAAADGAQIRVSNFAVHDLIVCKDTVIHIAIHDDQLMDNLIMAIITVDPCTVEIANRYCETLWLKSHPIVTNFQKKKLP